MGMDGFHYPNSYLETHYLERKGEKITLKSIKGAPELLKNRLIQRKIQGGLSEEESVRFYETSDRLNVERIAGHTVPANEEWQMLEDGDFARLK
ncbi:MAG: hypothetical protein J6O13_01200 [Selenomonas sp.]|nr:hypothetical protein [Selenomonas sp.]